MIALTDKSNGDREYTTAMVDDRGKRAQRQYVECAFF
jgi:hypothetical protein